MRVLRLKAYKNLQRILRIRAGELRADILPCFNENGLEGRQQKAEGRRQKTIHLQLKTQN